MMEEREKQAKEIVEGIEREWAGVGDRAERREAGLREEVERERRDREGAEKRVEQLETVLERMGRGELPVPGRTNGTPGTPLRTPGTPDLLMDGMLGLSPTVAMASKSQRSGKTFTEVYADYVRLQEDFAKKSAEYDHMDRTLSAVLAQIEERVRRRCFIVQLSQPFYRLPFSPNNALSTSACNPKPDSSPPNLLKPSPTATPMPRWPKITPKDSPKLPAKTTSFKNNSKISDAKSSRSSERLDDETIQQSPPTRISSNSLHNQPRT
jgi:hypothetical protein